MGTFRYYFENTLAAVNPPVDPYWISGTTASTEAHRLATAATGGVLTRFSHPGTADPNRTLLTRPFNRTVPFAGSLSGSFTAVVAGREQKAADDARLQVRIRVLSADGLTVRGVAYAGASSGTEFFTSSTTDVGVTTRTISAALTPVAGVQATDLLQVEVGVFKAGVGDGTTYTYLGDPAGSDYPSAEGAAYTAGRPWIEFVLDEPAAPPNPPTAITPTAITDTSASVGFTAPASGPAPTSYDYRLNGGPAITRPATPTTVSLTGLSPETEYTFEMRSQSAGLYSGWTAPVTITTLAAPAPEPEPEPTPVTAAGGCFTPVRGSSIRVTGLTARGEVPAQVEYVTSKSVVKVNVTEVVETGGTEVMKSPEEKRRLRLIKPTQIIRRKVDIEFLRVDPELLRLVAGVEVVYKTVAGFGKVPFGMAPFGGDANGTVVGFDSGTTLRATSFALEVWSRLDNASAKPRPLGFDEVGFDDTPFDAPAPGTADCGDGRQWGYTLFPFLRGGRLSGFKFADGLVSFNLIGAQTRRNPGWGLGPHDLTGDFQRLVEPVSRNTSWRMFITSATPPAEECGVQYRMDVLDNGTAANPMPDPDAPLVVDAGGAGSNEPWIIDGGRA